MEIIDLSINLDKNNIEKSKKFLSFFPHTYNDIDVLFYIESLEQFAASDFNDLFKHQDKIGEFDYASFFDVVETSINNLNKRWLNFFNHHDIKLNVVLTYNDDISIIEKYKNINKLIIKCKKEEFDIVKIHDTYKKYGLPIDIKVQGVAASLISSDDEILKSLMDYFPTWIKDKEGVLLLPYAKFIDNALGGSYRLCVNDSCIGKYFYMDNKGDIYTCNKPCLAKYCYGNISSINSLDDVYLSKHFERFVSKNIERRRDCQNCLAFKKCQGGCSSDSLLNNGKLEKINEIYCKNYKLLQDFIKQEIKKIVDGQMSLKELNPSMKLMVINSLKVENRL